MANDETKNLYTQVAPLKWVVVAASIAFLVIALTVLGLPYGFYTILRLIVCTSSVMLAWLAYHSEKPVLLWILGLTAVLYNPFAPMSLGREMWEVVNLLTIGLLVIGGLRLQD